MAGEMFAGEPLNGWACAARGGIAKVFFGEAGVDCSKLLE